MNKDEARLSVMGAISMALKAPTLQKGFEIICKNLTELEKENAELKNRNQELLESCEGATMMYKDLCKAKELLNEFLDFESSCMERGIYISDKIRAEAEQFLKDEPQSKWVNPARTTNDNQIKLSEVENESNY